MSEQASLETWREDLSQRASESGAEGSRVVDVDGFDEAVRIIRQLAEGGAVFSADDVRTRQRVGTPQVLGVAFRAARRAGWITPAGTTVALAVTAHGRLLRTWRAPDR